VIRREARRAGGQRLAVRGEGGGGQDRASYVGDLRRQRLAREETRGVGVLEADRDAVGGRIGVEGQPGGSGLGDGDLRHEELGAPAHPQPHDRARPDAAGLEAAGDGVGPGVRLRVGQGLTGRDQGRVIGAGSSGRGEDLAQDLVTQQVVASLA
jgi:hypothetical protein